MRISKRVTRRHRTKAEKVSRLTSRIFQAGRQAFKARTIMAWPGQQMPYNLPEEMMQRDEATANHEAAVLRRRVSNLIARLSQNKPETPKEAA